MKRIYRVRKYDVCGGCSVRCTAFVSVRPVMNSSAVEGLEQLD